MLMMKIAVESSLLKCEISKTSYRFIIDFQIHEIHFGVMGFWGFGVLGF